MKVSDLLREFFNKVAGGPEPSAIPSSPETSVAKSSDFLKRALPDVLERAAATERAALNYELYDLGIGIGSPPPAQAAPAAHKADFIEPALAGRDKDMLLIVPNGPDAKYFTDHNGFLLAMEKDGAAMRFESEKAAKEWLSAQNDGLASQFRTTMHPDGRGIGLLAEPMLIVREMKPAKPFKR